MTDAYKDNVVLLHGFFRTSRDMRPLKRFLEEEGFHVLSVDLPTTFGTMNECVERFEDLYGSLPLAPGPVSFVGHSMGGLIVLAVMARNRLPRPRRCVLIAAPVKGASLADRACACSPLATRVFRGLDALRTESVRALDIRAAGTVDIGTLAGANGRLLTGLFLRPPHDGRIEVSSARFMAAKDHAELPFTHTRIHKQRETAGLVAQFLRSGMFR